MSFYVLVELPPGFSATNRREAYDATRRNVGLHNDPQPNRNTHGRPSLNNAKFIFEGILTDDEIDFDNYAEMLAAELGLPVQPIKNIMKLIYFAPDEEWESSRQTCIAYLIANSVEWEESV